MVRRKVKDVKKKYWKKKVNERKAERWWSWKEVKGENVKKKKNVVN